jgi:hypothetical protein
MPNSEKLIKDLDKYVSELTGEIEHLYDTNKEKVKVELISVLEKTIAKLKGVESKG